MISAEDRSVLRGLSVADGLFWGSFVYAGYRLNRIGSAVGAAAAAVRLLQVGQTKEGFNLRRGAMVEIVENYRKGDTFRILALNSAVMGFATATFYGIGRTLFPRITAPVGASLLTSFTVLTGAGNQIGFWTVPIKDQR